MRRSGGLILAVLLLCSSASSAVADDLTQYRGWVEAMKTSERGPFSRVRWFCNDGTTQDPKPYGCAEHGGGSQHGEWNPQTRQLREQGFKIANILAGLDMQAFSAEPDFSDSFGQILVEKYLVGADDGWILRRAMFYRGAIQEEGERKAAESLFEVLLAQDYWLAGGFPALRTGAKVLPHGSDTQSIAIVRQDSAFLSQQDPAFKPLRSKIHGAPDASDAQRVRDYARSQAPTALLPAYEELAREIDRVYQPGSLEASLRERASVYDQGPWLQEVLLRAADELAAAPSPTRLLDISGRLMAELRQALPQIKSPQVRLQVLDLGLRTEQDHFRAAAQLRQGLADRSRQELLSMLFSAADAAYGAGLLNARLHRELMTFEAAAGQPEMTLGEYRTMLAYLAHPPSWALQALRMHFQASMDRLSKLEPKAQLFIQDQLRSSPLLFYSDVLETLLQDAGQLAGVRHRLFGEEITHGFSALNPGLSRGQLYTSLAEIEPERMDPKGIYLLPETIAELPPVAGILTAGEGNPLSHIQLLARNLGIPNVVVAHSLIARLSPYDQRQAVLAVSPGGLVELADWDARWEPYFANSRQQHVVIRPDLEKLDLSFRMPVSLVNLRAADSGRIVGPKSAKLGELKTLYPDAVAHGVALPFGLFYEHALLRPYPGEPTLTVHDWMKAGYRRLAALDPGSAEQMQQTEAFRAELYDTIAATPITPALRAALRFGLASVFAPGDIPGLYIRSDTNVEDLPGFTGAGLNLTLPNVVGFETLLEGIKRVWASPFTARAFAWRQSLMPEPEHVYTSVLLLQSVAVDVSGVMVTRDIDTGDAATLSIAVNEGPGGAVDGQAGESLRVPLDGSSIRVLSTAPAPTRRAMLPEGGVQNVPASGRDALLTEAELAQLREFARNLPQSFPSIVNAAGEPAPADVEFGFENGQLRLFQIRPFLDSATARGSDYLLRMDAALAEADDRIVDLTGAPRK